MRLSVAAPTRLADVVGGQSVRFRQMHQPPGTADLGAKRTPTRRGARYKQARSGRATLRACQLLLGHTKLESTVRYLGIEVDDALVLSEQTDL